MNYRSDFPILSKEGVYFDNACQSLRPQSVIDAITSYYTDYSACAGRSGHHLAEMVTKKYEESRQILANFLNAKRKEEIIFTRNTTEGINLIAHSLKFKEGDIIVTSDKEHNSNLIPWQVLVEKNSIEHKIVYSKVDNTFDLDEYKKLLNNKVRLVSLGLTSNLDGVTIPAKEIIELAHKAGALVLLDCAQAVPHKKIDVQDLDVDFLAFSGHKMLGPSGTGVLYGKYKLLEELEPFMVGGDTVSESTYTTHKFLPPPEKFEAGLQDYAGIVGLGEAVNYINGVGFKFIIEQELLLNKFITEELQNIPNLTIIGPSDPSKRSGIVSFYIQNKDHHQIALMLDETSKIMVRSGQHCVHSWFNAKKIKGSVRASFYFYNTIEEAEIFVRELKKVVSIL
ncbi:cysteine desulfurase [Candidatus Dojkabacteria bacterium]|nr:cysteine desulfurase [Candidatus Dojkabacteria bacterium]